MDQSISAFLAKQPVGCLAVALPNGTVHTAALHYSHLDEPFTLYFQSSRDTKKATAFAEGVAQASFTVGFSEEEWLTLQADGEARVLSDPAEIEHCQKVHYAKHPRAQKFAGPQTIYIEFKPRWYRYTDFNTHPETEIESE
jgi:general stress protein 26